MKLHKVGLVMILLICLVVPYDMIAVKENVCCSIRDAGYGFIFGGPFSACRVYSISIKRIILELIAVGAINYYLVNRNK